ncbi:olfactory receptor 1496 [Xenopus laevis]|uniref:Olfactory receptor n=2 Tax=Xenopus laevis TaxID=8355 RepID=A0A974C1B5_XENLA|nr:olfactory receptor 1496 [Xenopus laevis]OCT64644.1 hypothetical protein XELAEV_18045743mg [Xenopus laevis]
MGNKSEVPGFLLFDMSELTDSQFSLLLLIFLIYLMTLTGNLLIILLINTDANLQTPMYFFLENLSILDICMSSIPAPHLFYSYLTQTFSITYSNCRVQIFFLMLFATTEVCLLAMMSYDRYVAICYPLHYINIVDKKICAILTSCAWIIGLGYALVHTLCTLRLNFCYVAIIKGFFCELYQLIQTSCSDSFINILIIYVMASVVGVIAFFTISTSYFRVFRVILHNKFNKGRTKGFSTCTSHLTVIIIFYTTFIFNYFQPKTNRSAAAGLLSLTYSMFTPCLNPIIYSLRNTELKNALRRTLTNRRFVFLK